MTETRDIAAEVWVGAPKYGDHPLRADVSRDFFSRDGIEGKVILVNRITTEPMIKVIFLDGDETQQSRLKFLSHNPNSEDELIEEEHSGVKLMDAIEDNEEARSMIGAAILAREALE